jgi:hypothetical protein
MLVQPAALSRKVIPASRKSLKYSCYKRTDSSRFLVWERTILLA